MRVRCVCDLTRWCRFGDEQQGVMGDRKTQEVSTSRGTEWALPASRVGVMQVMESKVKGQEGIQTACTSRPRSGGAMNECTLSNQMDRGQTSFPKRWRREGGRTFGKKERNWSEMPSSSMAYLLFSFFFFLKSARQGAITTVRSECWKFWRTHLSTCRQVWVSVIVQQVDLTLVFFSGQKGPFEFIFYF